MQTAVQSNAAIKSGGVISGSKMVQSRLYQQPVSHKTYGVVQRRYRVLDIAFSLAPLLTSENIWCCFVACLGKRDLAHASV